MGPLGDPGAGREGDGLQFEAMLTRSAPMLIIAVRRDGEIMYASPGARTVIGFEADEIIGTNVIDYVHHDDAERALLTMVWRDDHGHAAPGVTRFRARHKASGYIDVETVASNVVVDGQEHLALYVRPAWTQVVAEEVLGNVVRGASRADALTTVLDSVSWSEHGSHVAIAWPEDGDAHQVNTGLPESLTGVDMTGVDNPWAECAATRRRVRRSLDGLEEETAAQARSVGMSELWVEPVLWSEDDVPALVTLWTTGGVHAPEIHGYGIRAARDFAELILRFTAQNRLLEEMAARDPLTGLLNRRVFFDRVAQVTSGGAVLYCDLDRFKPVNDDFGHAAGDVLLQAVAGRMTNCMRAEDVVARLGGDEFGVLCRRADRREALEIAKRLAAAFDQPFGVDGHTVSLGVTIGIAHGEGALGTDVIERADRALRAAKASGHEGVRADWDEPSGVGSPGGASG